MNFKIQHLLELLDDNSPQIRNILQQTLLANSLDIILKKPYYVLQAPVDFRERFIDLLEDLRPKLIRSAFQQLLDKTLEDMDLEPAVLLLSYWNDSKVDIPTIIHQLDKMAEEIGSRMPYSGHPLAFIDHISYYFFKKYGFRGNKADYYNPDNSFIDRVLETRKGIPITLSVIFMLIAKRLNLPVTGVPMPAHFILKFDNGNDEIFFDPFYQGRIYSRRECLYYLLNANVSDPESILSGCTNYEIVLRIMRNIHLVYSSYRDFPEKVAEIEQFLKMIENHYQ